MATKRFSSSTYKKNNVPSSNLHRPTRLKPQKMDEIRLKGLCFNCDSKYSKGHNCGENKLFCIDCEEKEANEQEPYQDEEIEEIAPTISCDALARYQKEKGSSVD